MASLLIVDDDDVIVEVLCDLLSEGHACHTAATAEEALGLLGSREYDLIITDISMPGLSGEDLLGFVRSHWARTPVIVVSGSANSRRAERLLVKGAFDYLAKPFRLEEIEQTVVRALESRRR